MMSIDADLSGIREIGTEFEEERPEIVVHTIEIVLVDDTRGLHDPRIRDPVRVASFLGAEQRGLLLRPPDEHHPLRRGEVLQVLVHHVVLALPLAEVHPRDALGLREPAHRPSEPVGDLGQRCG